jgi:Zn-dependent protease with chaperone function
LNFFKQQDLSRRNTKVLVFLFGFAVIAINLAIYLSVLIPIRYNRVLGNPGPYRLAAPPKNLTDWWDPQIFFYVTAGTFLVILFGALYMRSKLMAGGSSVARLLGGNPIEPRSDDIAEKRLQNIVEEMAIASGIPVPAVYVLAQEDSINAFAAGFTPSDAVIGVTQGTLLLLNRDELQGVIAHEFSHILNGDMRLNMRLTSLLHGILGIATIGYWILRFGGRGSRRKETPPILLLGVIFLIIGYIGVFFGRLIKASVSRQREYLADASAVQFTRNPGGIAAALKKIGGFASGSRVMSHNAETVSHIFFGNAMRSSFFGWMNSHPPLTDRIRKLDPNFKEKDLPVIERKKSPDNVRAWEARAGWTEVESNFAPPALPASELLVHVGSPQARHLEYAGAFLTSLPAEVAAAAHDTDGAKALIFAALLDSSEKVREKQFSILRSSISPEILAQVNRLFPETSKLGSRATIPLIDLAMPALRGLSLEEVKQFTNCLQLLIETDGHLSLTEIAVVKLVGHYMRQGLSPRKRTAPKYRTFDSIRAQAHLLLSIVAHCGAGEPRGCADAFSRGWKTISLDPVHPLPIHLCDPRSMHKALNELAKGSFILKRDILSACAETAATDGTITLKEAEALRAIAASFDCPIPPILKHAA